MRAVRDEVGDEVAVYAKLGMTDGVRGGLGVDEALDVASMLEADGCLDALQLTAGSSLLNPMYLFRGGVPLREFTAAMPRPVRWGMRTVGRGFLKEYPYEELFLLPHARRFRERVDLPLMLLGGISTRASLEPRHGRGLRVRRHGSRPAAPADLVNRMRSEGLTGSSCIHCNRCMPTIYTGTRCVLDDPEPLRLTTRTGTASAPAPAPESKEHAHDPRQVPSRRAGGPWSPAPAAASAPVRRWRWPSAARTSSSPPAPRGS